MDAKLRYNLDIDGNYMRWLEMIAMDWISEKIPPKDIVWNYNQLFFLFM